MKSKLVLLVLASAFLFGMTAYAHHSFASTYDLSKQVKLEGKLVQFLFRNPHSFVHVEAADGQRWAIEWAGGAQLVGSSIDKNTLKVGDPVIISGNPTRTTGEHRLRMVNFKRTSDGLAWGNRQGEVVD
ncbi:MAG TPA: DUF6152 family protein [Candidatus Binatia bacterium]|nr:DUF6152 family protein [Candidatus Binatia bacterium]